jgi:G:T/U-mismatch repair DNA glycosylase
VEVLPDIVAPEPVIVFCGLAGAASTKLRDHYYETPGNSFWESLHTVRIGRHDLRNLCAVLADQGGAGLVRSERVPFSPLPSVRMD